MDQNKLLMSRHPHYLYNPNMYFNEVFVIKDSKSCGYIDDESINENKTYVITSFFGGKYNVFEKYDKLAYLYDILPFVAVGTIADVVPLIGENRYYVLKGLDLISKGIFFLFIFLTRLSTLLILVLMDSMGLCSLSSESSSSRTRNFVSISIAAQR